MAPAFIREDKDRFEMLRQICINRGLACDVRKLELMFKITRDRMTGGQRLNYRLWHFFKQIVQYLPRDSRTGESGIEEPTCALLFAFLQGDGSHWIDKFGLRSGFPKTEAAFERSVNRAREKLADDEILMLEPKGIPLKEGGSITDIDGQ